MSIHHVHWKVGDIVHVIGNGRTPIVMIDDAGVVISRDGGIMGMCNVKYPFKDVHFICVAEARSWTRGDTVYLNGVTPTTVDHVYKSNWPIGIDAIEIWDSSTHSGSCFTAKPLDPELEQKRRLLEQKAAYQKFGEALAGLQGVCPPGASQWLADVMELFENDHDYILHYNEV